MRGERGVRGVRGVRGERGDDGGSAAPAAVFEPRRVEYTSAMSLGPYRSGARVFARGAARRKAWRVRAARALAWTMAVVGFLAAPVVLCALQPFSFFETALLLPVAAQAAVLFIWMWSIPALECPECGRLRSPCAPSCSGR